jgi:hypothetical protein
MNRTQNIASIIARTGFAFFLACIVAEITMLPFGAAEMLLGKIMPEWVQSSLRVVGISLGLLSGYKCFRWFFCYFRKHQVFYHE